MSAPYHDVTDREVDAFARRADPVARLAELRGELRRRRLTGFVVPRADEHQNEYVSARAERLHWLTGFSGSAGTAVVLHDRAAVFVDGRYTVQAAGEVNARLYELRHLTREPVPAWLSDYLPPNGRLGYDPWLHTPSQVTALETACRDAGGRAIAVGSNPIDRIWVDQPPPPLAPVTPHDVAYAGISAADKRAQIAEVLRAKRQDAAILSAPDSIAWLLNIRGGDLPYVPVALAFAILEADGHVSLFIDARKVTARVRAHLGDGVTVADPAAMDEALGRLGGGRMVVRIDPERTPFAVVRRLRLAGARIVDGQDPCLLPKALKNATEQAGIRVAHVRDGAAVTRFLAWLAVTAPSGGLTEMAAAERLCAFRRADPLYRGPSFTTISGAGANGAIVHYRVDVGSNRPLVTDSLYLIDSGAQYPDGTTDITRTIAIGTPSAEMRQRFTLVLKGHIALAVACFPKGTTGPQLDVLARRPLWSHGLDYDHGTGHGVGSYASVHEGPQSISKMPNRTALEPGMILSNEPGYYKRGAYGIRIENLVLVTTAPTPADGEQELLAFETLTLVPIDRSLIDPALLTVAERDWLDDYHARVRDVLMPLLDGDAAAWLAAATRPLAA